MLNGKHILLGVTGSVAAYKALELISLLKKQGADIKVVMSEAATKFITPLSFASVTQHAVAVDMFDENHEWEIEHISLAKWADIAMIAPATANIIGKLAAGIADDMISTVFMATKAPLLIAPAMNTAMYENISVQENIKTLSQRGIEFIGPENGKLACGDTGKGHLISLDIIVDAIINKIGFKKDFEGKNVLVTAGATIESIDPVRYITNHSTGKMGVAVALAARYRGANVTLIHGSISVPLPSGLNCVAVKSADDMYKMCIKHFPENDILIKAAAVADFKPCEYAENKIKKNTNLNIELCHNKDILSEISKIKQNRQTVVGFCMETQDLIANATQKLKNKNLDLIVANNLFEKNAGFASDNNTVSIVDKSGNVDNLPNMSKFDVANKLLDKLLLIDSEKNN